MLAFIHLDGRMQWHGIEASARLGAFQMEYAHSEPPKDG